MGTSVFIGRSLRPPATLSPLDVFATAAAAVAEDDTGGGMESDAASERLHNVDRLLPIAAMGELMAASRSSSLYSTKLEYESPGDTMLKG